MVVGRHDDVLLRDAHGHVGERWVAQLLALREEGVDVDVQDQGRSVGRRRGAAGQRLHYCDKA